VSDRDAADCRHRGRRSGRERARCQPGPARRQCDGVVRAFLRADRQVARTAQAGRTDDRSHRVALAARSLRRTHRAGHREAGRSRSAGAGIATPARPSARACGDREGLRRHGRSASGCLRGAVDAAVQQGAKTPTRPGGKEPVAGDVHVQGLCRCRRSDVVRTQPGRSVSTRRDLRGQDSQGRRNRATFPSSSRRSSNW